MHLNLVFPVPKTAPRPKKTFAYKTIVQTPANNRGEICASLTPYPIWEIKYDNISFLRGNEGDNNSLYQQMVSFFGAAQGRLNDFLFDDPTDNTVSSSSPAYFGIGDGTTTQFQLQRQIGFMNDIVQNLNGSPVIYSNGTAVSSSLYTVSSLGIVTFTTAPEVGKVLTWSGKFYYRVRFKEDTLDFPAFARNIYECDSLEFISKIL